MTDQLHPTLVALTEPISVAAEQYRVLCAKLTKLCKESGPRIIAVTSSVKGEGKTLTSVNLSIAMAKDFDRRVLLIEVDLKSPTLARLLGRKMNGGFTDLVSNETDLAQSGISYFDGRLMVLPAGRPMNSDIKLLSSEKTRVFLDDMKKEYDYIFLDLPPILALADATVATDLADKIIMVIRAGQTPQNIVKRAMGDLDSNKILGVVLNDVQSSMSYYYYYHRDKK